MHTLSCTYACATIVFALTIVFLSHRKTCSDIWNNVKSHFRRILHFLISKFIFSTNPNTFGRTPNNRFYNCYAVVCCDTNCYMRMLMLINGYEVFPEKFYTVRKTVKIIDEPELLIHSYVKKDLFKTDERIGVYRRISGDSIIKFIELPELFTPKAAEAGTKGFSLFKNLETGTYLKKRLKKLKRECYGKRCTSCTS